MISSWVLHVNLADKRLSSKRNEIRCINNDKISFHCYVIGILYTNYMYFPYVRNTP
jgi:hypothetical protein